MSTAALLEATNVQRAIAKVPLLSTHQTLQTAAQEHANWMAAKQRLSHAGEGGSTFAGRVANVGGYPPAAMAENIAAGQRTAGDCVASWAGSSGHRANMLNPSYRTAGCGMARALNGVVYWCALYGTARSDSVPPPIVPPKPTLWDWFRDLFRFSI